MKSTSLIGGGCLGGIIVLIFLPMIFICCVLSGSDIIKVEIEDTDQEIVADNQLTPPFLSSVKYTITSPFGTRIDPINGKTDFHSGVDLVADPNTLIVASASGVVIKVDTSDNSLGNHVFIKHEINGQVYITGYGHMKKGSIMVREGQQIMAKKPIGIIGATGRVTGIHCHFMLYKDSIKKDNLLDPMSIVKQNN